MVERQLEFVFNSARVLELPGSCSSDDARIVYKHRELAKTLQDVLVELVPLTAHDLNVTFSQEGQIMLKPTWWMCAASRCGHLFGEDV